MSVCCNRLLLLLLVFPLLFACGKIDLTEGTGDQEGDGEKEGTGVPSDPVDPSDICHVADLAGVSDDVEVILEAYIVGYVPANSTIKRTAFTAEEAVETNIVVADAPDETDYSRCAAMQLTKGSEPRWSLNLLDNPDNLGRYVRLYGKKATYYGAPGLKPVMSYSWPEEDEDEDDGGGEVVTPTTLPTVDREAPAIVFDGV